MTSIFFIDKDDMTEEISFVHSILTQNNYDKEITKHNVSHCEVVVRSNEMLILHFSTHPQPKMAPCKIVDKIIIDSLEDIAVNKVTCLPSRDEPKDVFDLYSILNNTNFTFDYLLNRAREKEGFFDSEENILQLAATKLLDVPLEPVPRLINDIESEDVKSFFGEIAKEIINRYRPKDKR
jgi:predicted nucleotidyltransferase component of viral defense system